jgi:hypothetical protein
MERMMMKIAARSSLILSAAVLGCIGASSARADFFDDARQTFTKDVPHFFQKDVPHFFQDDIPCAFGGQPTSHTKRSCDDRGNSVQRPAQTYDVPPAEPNQDTREPPVYDQ